jgi:hypothetical protein
MERVKIYQSENIKERRSERDKNQGYVGYTVSFLISLEGFVVTIYTYTDILQLMQQLIFRKDQRKFHFSQVRIQHAHGQMYVSVSDGFQSESEDQYAGCLSDAVYPLSDFDIAQQYSSTTFVIHTKGKV